MDGILWIVIIIIGIVQIIMIIRFFEMASYIRDIRDVMIEFWKIQKADQGSSKNNETVLSKSSTKKEEKSHDKSVWDMIEKTDDLLK